MRIDSQLLLHIYFRRRKRSSRQTNSSPENTQRNIVTPRGPDADVVYDEISEMATNQAPESSPEDQYLHTIIEPTSSPQKVLYEQVAPPVGYENVAVTVDPDQPDMSAEHNEIQNEYEQPSNYVNMVDRPNTYDSLTK